MTAKFKGHKARIPDAVPLQRRFAARSVFALTTLFLFVALAVPLKAQVATGSLTGPVTDSTGRRVVGALAVDSSMAAMSLRTTDF